jgi:hypothetical protein
MGFSLFLLHFLCPSSIGGAALNTPIGVFMINEELKGAE